MSHRIPDYHITINDKNATFELQGRLISLTLTDERGNEADQLDISLDDSDGQLPLPQKKAVIKVWLGFKASSTQEAVLVYKGAYTVDEIRYGNTSGTDTLDITARSADFKGPLKVKREQSWHKHTLGEIVTTIAKRNSLTPRITASLAATQVDHIDQTSESDISFLNRLADRYDALCTIKDGNLLFSEMGRGLTVSGKPLPTLKIHISQCSSYSYQTQERDSEYTGVTAMWNDRKYARREKVVIGDAENPKVLRTTYASAAHAQAAAKAAWQKLSREQATMELELSEGLPQALPEMPVELVGFKDALNRHQWAVENITHALTGSALSTRIALNSR